MDFTVRFHILLSGSIFYTLGKKLHFHCVWFCGIRIDHLPHIIHNTPLQFTAEIISINDGLIKQKLSITSHTVKSVEVSKQVIYICQPADSFSKVSPRTNRSTTGDVLCSVNKMAAGKKITICQLQSMQPSRRQ